jgi:hypothetical protein
LVTTHNDPKLVACREEKERQLKQDIETITGVKLSYKVSTVK